MSKKLNNLVAFLTSEKVTVAEGKAETFSEQDEALLIFSELIPDRVCSYDTEIIDDIDGYYTVLQSHIETTLGEWAVKDIHISGEIVSKITIEFLHTDKKVKWKFDQHNTDYVSEDFYKKLNRWVSSNLKGKFVSLPTYGQDVAFVYLPKKSAAKVAAFVKNIVSPNEFVQYFRNDDDLPNSFDDLRFNTQFDINCWDDNGETALTAAINALNETKALHAMNYFEVNPVVKNKNGMSPLQLSRKFGLKEVSDHIESRVTKKTEKWSNTEVIFGTEKFGLFGPMIDLISALKESKDLDNLYHYVESLPWLDFAKAEKFEIGHDSLNVGPYYVVGVDKDYGTYSVKYYSESGNDYVKENIGLAETLDLIDRFYE